MKTKLNHSLSNPTGYSEAAIWSQLERISNSTELGSSQKLLDVLNYIVGEVLAGRARQIKGSTIGHAVFDNSGNFDPESNSIVRVEMGRLRRRLVEYYTGMGEHDSLIISIPKGNYIPKFTENNNFEKNPESNKQPTNSKFPSKIILIWLGSIAVVSALLTAWNLKSSSESPVVPTTELTVLQLHTTNPEAQALFDQAFMLMMPPEDETRLQSSFQLFQRVIELDDDFAGGYAGKSVVLLFKIFFIKSSDATSDLGMATKLAQIAVEIDSEFSMGFAALALSSALSGDTEGALENAKKTIAFRPPDPNAYAIASLGLIKSGYTDEAIDILSEAIKLNPDQPRTPYLNMLGTAYFANKNYAQSAESFELNLKFRGPSGPHISLFLAASYAYLNRDFEARAILSRVVASEPDFPVKRWFSNFVQSEIRLNKIMSKLASLEHTE